MSSAPTGPALARAASNTWFCRCCRIYWFVVLLAPRAAENTTIGIVATNAKLTKAEVSRMALMGDDGYARAIFPSHTMGDGDTVFSLATGRWEGEADVSLVGALAADAMAKALVQAVMQATGLPNIPAVRDLQEMSLHLALLLAYSAALVDARTVDRPPRAAARKISSSPGAAWDRG